MGKILIVEDELEIVKTLELSFKASGHELVSADTLTRARIMLAQTNFDAILLDLNLPDGNGLDLCKEIRSRGNTVPILIITARRDEVDRILGLEFGADDYIVKPFSPREVAARVAAVLRRQTWANNSNGQKEDCPDILEYQGLKADRLRREVLVNGKAVNLTRTEYRLVETLLRRPGMVYSRDQLIDLVWDGNFIQHRVVDSVISRLRRKLGELPDGRPRIRTVHGVGYALTEVRN